MARKLQSDIIEFTFPTQEEVLAAQRACCGRACQACETPMEYAWRKRDVDLSLLLEVAIREELTPAERRAVEQYWFAQKTLREIGEESGIAPNAVYGTLKRGEKRLYRVLRYVVMYQHDMEEDTQIMPAVLQRAAAILAAKYATPETFGQRLQALRRASALSLEKAAQLIQQDSQRLIALERGVAVPTLQEAVMLAAAYAVSLDAIVLGSERRKTSDEQDPEQGNTI